MDWTLIELIVATVAFGVALVPASMAAALSPMNMAAPDAAGKRRVRVAFFAVLTAPVVIMLALLAAWVLFFLGLRGLAVGVSLLPLVNGVVFFTVGRMWERDRRAGKQ